MADLVVSLWKNTRSMRSHVEISVLALGATQETPQSFVHCIHIVLYLFLFATLDCSCRQVRRAASNQLVQVKYGKVRDHT